MTLSAIDNPYGLIGADSMDADKSAKNSAFSGNSDVFARLLQTTGVQQVAYAGNTSEFDETLDMQNETVGHEARMGEDHQKYDGLGLDGADAAAIESTRSPRKLESAKDGEAGKLNKDGSDLPTGTNGDGNGSGDGDAAITDTAELLALAAPVQESAVDVTRAANAAAAQRAADANLTRPNGQNAQNVPAQVVKPQQTVSAEELPKSRYASSQPQSETAASNAAQQKNGIKVTKLQEDAVSQPTSTLAASATLAAQTNKSTKATLEAPVDLADDLDGEVRAPLANANAARPVGRPQPAAPQAQPNPQQANTPPANQPPVTPAPPQLPNAATQQAQLASTAARGDIGSQPTQTVNDPLAGGPANNNAGQNAQRAQQTQAPRPARPPVPPQEVTNQVAVQIKKAISQGNDLIRIQLKPAELGRVEVKLEVAEDGRAMAVVSAERAETLDLLQRDASGLRQALQDAGLSTDSNSLSFNLRGEGSKFEQEMADRGHAPKRDGDETADTGNSEDDDAAEAALIAAQTAASDGRVNVQI